MESRGSYQGCRIAKVDSTQVVVRCQCPMCQQESITVRFGVLEGYLSGHDGAKLDCNCWLTMADYHDVECRATRLVFGRTDLRIEIWEGMPAWAS